MSDPKFQQEQQQRFAVVALGIEAEQFITSPLGRYLVARAEEEREKALAELVVADPHKPELVQQLQNAVKLVDLVQQWIADAITEGAAMEQQMVTDEVEGGGSAGPPQ